MSSSKLKILIFVGAVAAAIAAPIFAAETKTISSVEVQEVDGVTRVVLLGAEDPIYTAFMRQDPPRLIVEMLDVTFSGVASPIAADTALVDEVQLGAFGDPRVSLSMARVSVGIRGESDYELIPNGTELVIEVRPTSAVGQSSTQEESVPAAPEAGQIEEAVTEELGATSPEAPAAVEEPSDSDASTEETAEPEETAASAANEPSRDGSTYLTGINSTENGVQVQASGTLDNVDSFELDDPPRLVVDFWGVGNRINLDQQNLSSETIKQVRVGEHADKVRVVFDLTESGLDHSVEGTSSGALVMVGSALADRDQSSTESVPAAAADEEVDPIDLEAEASNQENVNDTSIFDTSMPEQGLVAETDTAPSEESSTPAAASEENAHVFGNAQVEGVHFESLPATDRVVVTLSNPAETQVVTPDADTTIVMIRNSKINSGAERRVDTSDFAGPVQHFSVFQTPDVDYEEVRVVLKRGSEASAALHWSENQLYIEVPREAVGSSDWDMPAN